MTKRVSNTQINHTRSNYTRIGHKRIQRVRSGNAEEGALLLLPAPVGSCTKEGEAAERTAASKQAAPWMKVSHPRLVALLLVLLLAAVVTGWNLLNYPRYEYGEGTSVSAAWAMFKQSRLSYYTYNYSQGTLGWFQIGAWTALVQGEKVFGLFINSARVLMLVATIVSTWLLFQTVFRATGRTLAALGTALLFAASPLGVGLHRQVWVDNLATLWLLLSLYLLVIAPGRLDRVLLSAAAFSIALLTQKSFMVFLPGLCYFAWKQAHPVHRHHAGALWGTITVSAVSLFVVMAVFRGELFPAEIFSPFQRPHVSLMGTWFFPLPAGRGGSVLDPWGDFNKLWPQWLHTDPVLAIGGTLAAGIGLSSKRFDPLLFHVSALIVSFLLFLMIDTTVISADVIPLVALLSLSLGLTTAMILKAIVEKTHKALNVLASGILAILLLCFGGWALAANKLNLTADATSPQRLATCWIAGHLSRQSVIVTDTYALADLSDPAFTSGHPFTLVNDEWASANDPSVRDGLLNNDWHRIDFLVTSPTAQKAIAPVYQPLVAEAWKHSVVIQVFGTGQNAVEVRQVRVESGVINRHI